MSKDIRVPEGYKKTELGVIPEEWEVTKLKDCCDRITDGFHNIPKLVEYGIPLLDSTYIDERYNINIDKAQKFISKDVDTSGTNRCKPKKDDILISSRGSIGKLALVKANQDFNIMANIALIRPNVKIDSLFLLYYLSSEFTKKQLEVTSYGSSQKALYLKNIKNIKLIKLPLPEQQKIAFFISKVDGQIEKTEQIIERIQLLKKGLLQRFVTSNMGNTNLNEKEAHQLPSGWKWVNLGDVTSESKQRNNGNFSDGDLYAVTKVNGLIPMRDRVKGKSLDRCKVVKTTAFAYNPMRLNIGSIARWEGEKPVIVSPDYVVFECNTSKIDSSYLDYIRKSHPWAQFVENAGNGSVRIRIYYKNLAEFQFLLPPLQEQKRMVNVLKNFDEVLEVEQERLKHTLTIKKGLIQDLLSGRVRVKLDKEVAVCN